MQLADLQAMVGIHAASWSPRELSVKLGPEFLRVFYQQVLRSEHAFGYVASDGDVIIGYAVGFGHYAAFNKEFRRALGLAKWILVLRGLARGRIRLPDLLNLVLDRRKFRNARFAQYHLGAIALAEPFKGTLTGRAAVQELMHSVEQALLERDHSRSAAPGLSCTCDARNIPMRRSLERMGYDLVDEIPFVGRSIVLYEKSLASAALGTG